MAGDNEMEIKFVVADDGSTNFEALTLWLRGKIRDAQASPEAANESLYALVEAITANGGDASQATDLRTAGRLLSSLFTKKLQQHQAASDAALGMSEPKRPRKVREPKAEGEGEGGEKKPRKKREPKADGEKKPREPREPKTPLATMPEIGKRYVRPRPYHEKEYAFELVADGQFMLYQGETAIPNPKGEGGIWTSVSAMAVHVSTLHSAEGKKTAINGNVWWGLASTGQRQPRDPSAPKKMRQANGNPFRRPPADCLPAEGTVVSKVVHKHRPGVEHYMTARPPEEGKEQSYILYAIHLDQGRFALIDNPDDKNILKLKEAEHATERDGKPSFNVGDELVFSSTSSLAMWVLGQSQNGLQWFGFRVKPAAAKRDTAQSIANAAMAYLIRSSGDALAEFCSLYHDGEFTVEEANNARVEFDRLSAKWAEGANEPALSATEIAALEQNAEAIDELNADSSFEPSNDEENAA